MKKLILVTKKIKKFNHKITVDGDKSLSIRFALLASQARGKSTAYNLLSFLQQRKIKNKLSNK